MRTTFLNRVFVTVATGLLLASADMAHAAGDVTPKVAVIAGLDPARINPGTVELYRQVSARLVERGVWIVAQDQEVRGSLVADTRLKALGSIAAVDRSKIVKTIGGKKKSGRMIRDIQAMTDTLALDGAVLVDCRTASNDKLRACAVYYYDRGVGRIVAASSKSFRVPIADATRWAPVLVDQMISGLEAHRSVKTRERLEQMMVEGEDSAFEMTPFIGVEVLGVGIEDPRGDIASLPTASVSFGTQGTTFSAALYGEVGEATSRHGDVSVRLLERSLGLAFAARSRALESIYWDVGIAGGLLSREANREGASLDDAGRQREKAFRLKIHPGLLWQFGDHVQVGPSLYWIKDVALDREATGSMDGNALEASGWGAGMRLKTVF